MIFILFWFKVDVLIEFIFQINYKFRHMQEKKSEKELSRKPSQFERIPLIW